MNQYALLSPEEQEELQSNYLISHWSVSGVNSFIRNEKAFEKQYIYKVYDEKRSVSSIIGSCYDDAVTEFFEKYKESGKKLGFDALSIKANQSLDNFDDDQYKPSTIKTLEEQKSECQKKINFLLTSFLEEVDSYLDEIQEILFIQKAIITYITLDGIDIPIPLKMIADLIFINKKGELCIADHKARGKYTDEADVHVTCSKQATAYDKGVSAYILHPDNAEILKKYPKAKNGVKWFYYYENKHAKNKDGSRQIRRIDIEINETSKMYEAILFEGVWKMLRAVQDPDYIYLMNPDDYFTDKAELLDFWVKTRIEGLDGFPNLDEKQKAILKTRKKDLRKSSISKVPKSMIKEFKEQAGFVSFNNNEMSELSLEEKVEHRLRSFNFKAKVAHKIEGYACDTYLLEVAVGVRIGNIHNYRLDIASAIGVNDVRIAESLVEYDGGNYVSIEANKKDRKGLFLQKSDISPSGYLFPIGKDNFGNEISWDMGSPSSPHLLVAGATGSGKSVAIQTIIETALKKGIKVAIIDPKYEFVGQYPNCEIVTDQPQIEEFMARKVAEMDQIYKTKGAKGNTGNKQMIIFDEASDCFTRQMKIKGIPSLEQNTLLLAQKARSAGIHLVLSSQRWSVKVMTGDAKANFTTRLCLTVASQVDSKVMLDEEGGEKLNGIGDALFRDHTMNEPKRIQCYLTE